MQHSVTAVDLNPVLCVNQHAGVGKRQDGKDLQKIGWLNLVMQTKAACNLLPNPSCEMKQNRREARLIIT